MLNITNTNTKLIYNAPLVQGLKTGIGGTRGDRLMRLIGIDWLVAWHSGRTSVCNRRIFHVLRSTCSWWVTTYVGKPSTTRSANSANSAFHPFEVDK